MWLSADGRTVVRVHPERRQRGGRVTAEDSLADGPDVYWFVGGPLDGRVDTREPSDPAHCTVRFVHLHDGPKIVHHYDLHEVAGHGGEYRLRAADPDEAG
jgi:hypothetical protein